MRASRLQDPRPTFENLSAETGIPVEDLIHHARVRGAAAGGEALWAAEPLVLVELTAARAREDGLAVAGLVDWLVAGDPGP